MKQPSDTAGRYRRTPLAEAYPKHKIEKAEKPHGVSAFSTGIRPEWSKQDLGAAAVARPEETKSDKQEPPPPRLDPWMSLLLPGDAYNLDDFPEVAEIKVAGKSSAVTSFIYEGERGFRVLYARSVCFVDVDIAAPTEDGARRLRSEMLRLVHRHIAINPEFGIRCYCTAGGLRYMVTSHLMAAKDRSAQGFLMDLGSDPKFVAMCMHQGMFGARLDPKPERCTEPSENYAACQFLWQEGNPLIHPEVLPVLKEHDRESGAHSGRPLA